MKKFSKIIAIALALATILSMTVVMASAEGETMTYEISAPEKAAVEEQFTVEVSVPEGHEVLSATIAVNYDAEALELVSSEKGAYTGNFMMAMLNGAKVNCVNVSGGTTVGGVALKLVFKGLKEGDATLSIDTTQTAYRADNERFVIAEVSKTVVIGGEEETSTTEEETTTTEEETTTTEEETTTTEEETTTSEEETTTTEEETTTTEEETTTTEEEITTTEDDSDASNTNADSDASNTEDGSDVTSTDADTDASNTDADTDASNTDADTDASESEATASQPDTTPKTGDSSSVVYVVLALTVLLGLAVVVTKKVRD